MMRKYIILLSLLFIGVQVSAQFTGTDSLRNYNYKYITNNPATAFTNLRLHTLLRGIIDFIDTARAGTGGGGLIGVDTLYALNDSTIRYRKNGVFRNVVLKGVYDSRRKVDTAYAVNDTTLRITINGQVRSIIIPGRGGSNTIAKSAQTADGDYIQDWNHKWLYFNNLNALNFVSDDPDPNHPFNRKQFQFYSDSTIDDYPLRIMWGLKNINNDATDSVHFELSSTNSTTHLHHYTADSAKSVKIDMNAGATNPDVQILTNGNSKSSSYKFGNTTNLSPADSVLIKAIAAATSDTVLATRAFGNGVNTVIKIPASAIAGTPTILTNVGTGFAWATTPNGSIKRFNPTYGLTGDSSTSNTISLKADTSSTNHLVTQSDLNDAIGGVTVTLPDGLTASTSGTARVANDSDIVNSLRQFPLLHNGLSIAQGDSIFFFGDSYTYGSGSSSSANAWTSILSNRMGAVQINYGVPGSTLMYESPYEYQGATAMTRRLSQIPAKRNTISMLVFAFGLNDLGQTAAAYTSANYRLAYDTVLNNAISKGWSPKQILIIPPYWLSTPGYAAYATITGNAAPTRARHLEFVKATQFTATKWQTMYFDIFENQLIGGDTTLNGDNIHMNDAGHAYVASTVGQYLSVSGSPFSQQTAGITANILNSSLILGSQTPGATATPTTLNLGATYANAAGSPALAKLKFYDDGTANNVFGFGISSGAFEYYAGGNLSEHKFYINGTQYLNLDQNNGLTILNKNVLRISNVTTGTSTATPALLNMGATYANSTGAGSKMKIRVYDNGTSLLGFGMSTNGLEYFSTDGLYHDFYNDGSLTMRVKTTGVDITGDATVADEAYDATDWNGSLEVPTKNAIRDKIESMGSGSDGNGIYTGNGSLSGATTITGAGNTLTMTGTQSSAAAFNVNNTGNGEALSATTTGTGSALSTNNSSTGPAATFSSNSGFAVNTTSTSGTLFRGTVNPSSTNTDVVTFRTIRQSSGTPDANMSQTWSQDLEDDGGNNISAVQHKSIWTSVAAGSTSADYQLWTVGSGSLSQKLTIKGTGQVQHNQYGSGTFSVTPATTPVYSSNGTVGERIAPKIYTALLTQSGTGAPTATVLGTNEIGSIVWTRNSTGNYTGTLTGAFTANKTWLVVQRGDQSGTFVNNILSWTSANALLLTVQDNAANPTDNFTNMSIEIKVYP